MGWPKLVFVILLCIFTVPFLFKSLITLSVNENKNEQRSSRLFSMSTQLPHRQVGGYKGATTGQSLRHRLEFQGLRRYLAWKPNPNTRTVIITNEDQTQTHRPPGLVHSSFVIHGWKMKPKVRDIAQAGLFGNLDDYATP